MKRTRTALTALAALTLTMSLASPILADDHRGGDHRDYGRDGGGDSGRFDRTPPAPAPTFHRDDRGRDGDRDQRFPQYPVSNYGGWQRPVFGIIQSLLAPRVQYVQRGHWETRMFNVLVEPAHFETRVIPAECQTFYDRYGRPVTVCVQPERQERVFVPDRYECRTQQVWVQY